MIGKKLKELIKSRNIKQVKLAEYLDISPSRLCNYLADKREPACVTPKFFCEIVVMFAIGAVASSTHL